MHGLSRRLALPLALSATVLLGAATTSPGGGDPIVGGHGDWIVPDGSTIGFQVSAVELPDGSLVGRGISYRHSSVDGNSWFHFDVIEVMPIGDELAVLGLITRTKNIPLASGIVPGTLTALLIQDNGDDEATPDKAISASGLPPFLTLADILPNAPPPDFWFPLDAGNFVIH